MKNVLFGLLAICLLASCNKTLLKDNDMIPLSQYGDGIIEFSSEYSASPGPWSSFVVLGAPDTYPSYGDLQTAWASSKANSNNEYLTIGFDTAQYVNQIDIYETFNPGAVTTVSVRNKENGSWSPVYTGEVNKNLPKASRIMKIDFPQTSFLVDAIKISISSSQVPGYNEIDAVKIIGEFEID